MTPARTSTESVAGPPSGPDRPRGRLVGIDMARALAFGGMLLAHFAAPRRAGDPDWLQSLDNAADGRAAPLFCILLGAGAGLLATRGAPGSVYLRRGVVLLGLGLSIWPYVDRIYLILPQYGFLLAILPVLRRLATRWLLPLAGLAFLLPSVIVSTLGPHGLRAAPQPSSHGELLDAIGLMGNILWRGAYPVAGWVGFVLLGLWLVRLRLDDPGVQWRLLAGAAVVALTQPVVDLVFTALGGRHGRRATGLAVLFDSSPHSNQAAWYLLASATAVVVIAACLALTRRRPAWARPLVALGQMALSAYVAHILLGTMVVWEWRDVAMPPLAVQMILVLGIFAVFAAVATVWLARYRRGPLEAVVRALSG